MAELRPDGETGRCERLARGPACRLPSQPLAPVSPSRGCVAVFENASKFRRSHSFCAIDTCDTSNERSRRVLQKFQSASMGAQNC